MQDSIPPMINTTSHLMSSSTFTHHHQHGDRHPTQEQVEEDESELSSLDGEGDTDMEDGIHTTSRTKSHIYHDTSLDTSSPSICLPRAHHPHPHPPSAAPSSIMKPGDNHAHTRHSRSISPEIPLAQLAIHNGSIPPTLQLQLPTASHRLQPQPMMETSSPPDIPSRSSIKRRRGHSYEPKSKVSNMTPSNMCHASNLSSTSYSNSTSASTRKTANLSRFSRLYSAQSLHAHCPAAHSKGSKSALQDDDELAPSIACPPSSSSKSTYATKFRKTPQYGDAKEELKRVKGRKNTVKNDNNNNNIIKNGDDAGDMEVEVEVDDEDAVSLLFAIREERNAAVVARERIASSDKRKKNMAMDVVYDLKEMMREQTMKARGAGTHSTGDNASVDHPSASSSYSYSASLSTATSTASSTPAALQKHHLEAFPTNHKEIGAAESITQASNASPSNDETAEDIGGFDWRRKAQSTAYNQEKYKMAKGMRYHGKSFGENLLEYIEARPHSTTVAWSGDKKYLLIYDLDKLRMGLNAAGLAQQSHVYSLKKQLNNYNYTLVTDVAVKERLSIGLTQEQKILLQVYKPNSSSIPSRHSQRQTQDSDYVAADSMSPPAISHAAETATADIEDGHQSESELSDVVADDEAEISECHTLKNGDASSSSSSNGAIPRHTSFVKKDFVNADCSDANSASEGSGLAQEEKEDQTAVTRSILDMKERVRGPGRAKATSSAKAERTQPGQALKGDEDMVVRNTRSTKRSIREVEQSDASLTAQASRTTKSAKMKAWHARNKAEKQSEEAEEAAKQAEEDNKLKMETTKTTIDQPIQTPPRKRVKTLHRSSFSSTKAASASPRRNVHASLPPRWNKKNLSISPQHQRMHRKTTSQLPQVTRANSVSVEMKQDSPRLLRHRPAFTSRNKCDGTLQASTPELKRNIRRSASSRPANSGPDDPPTDPRFLRALARRWSPSPPPQRRATVKIETKDLEQADQDTEDDVAAMKQYEDGSDADIDEELDAEAHSPFTKGEPLENSEITEGIKFEGREDFNARSATISAHPEHRCIEETDEAQLKEKEHERAIPSRSIPSRSIPSRPTSTQPVAAQLDMYRALNGFTKASRSGDTRMMPRKRPVLISLPYGANADQVTSITPFVNDKETCPPVNPSLDSRIACLSEQAQNVGGFDNPAVISNTRKHDRSVSASTAPTSIHLDERQPQEDQDMEDSRGSAPKITSQIKSMLTQAIPSVEVELASCNGTPELEVDTEDDALCQGNISTDSGYHASSKFFPEYLHPLSSPALRPVPDVPIIKNDPADEEDLAELLFRINMPSPRAMLAGLPTGRTPETYRNRLEVSNDGKSGLSRLDSNESVLWSRSNALKAELPTLKFAGSNVPVFPDMGMLPSQSALNEDLVTLAQPAGLYNNQPFESNPPVPPEWKVYEIFSPVKTRFDQQHTMQSVQSWLLSGDMAEYGDKGSPERMFEDTPSQYGSEGSRGKSISPFDTVPKN